MVSRKNHWNKVYGDRGEAELSWFQDRPDVSLRLIDAAALDPDSRIIDVGGGASRLVDCLLDRGYRHLGVLDVSAFALELTQARLGSRAKQVEWFVTDLTEFRSPHPWDLWHDRAVFHFLTDEGDRKAYREVLMRSLAPSAQVVVSTFGPEGPQKCSGLDVRRYDSAALGGIMGAEFELLEEELEEHVTPGGSSQQFMWCRFRLK